MGNKFSFINLDDFLGLSKHFRLFKYIVENQIEDFLNEINASKKQEDLVNLSDEYGRTLLMVIFFSIVSKTGFII